MKRLVIFLVSGLFCIGTLFAQSGTDDNITWEITDGVLTISGSGDMPFWYMGNPNPWWNHIPTITSIEIGHGITNLSNSVFNGFYNIASVSIPETVTRIGDHAFSGCSKLTSITISASVTSIGDAVFGGCSALTSILVDAGNTEYFSEEGVLYHNDKTLVSFPDGKHGACILPEWVTSIGIGAFRFSSNVTSVTIPASVKSIGSQAFYRSRINSISISESVSSIGSLAFGGCGEMTSISVASGNMDFSSDEGVLFNKEMSMLVAFPSGIQGSYTVPEPVETIGYGAFWESKPARVIFPASLKIIGNSSFRNSNLESVTIPSSVTTIEALAFENCLKLSFVSIPASVTTIGDWAFLGCVQLSEIVNASPMPQILRCVNDGGVFSDVTYNTCMLWVPAGSADKYKKAEEWKKFKNIIEEGTASIEGTVHYDGDESVTVYLYMKIPEDAEQSSLSKARIVGGYVLLAKTTPNANGWYSFENLPEGTYKVDVEIDGFTSELSPELNISVGATRLDVNFTVINNTFVVVPIVTSVTDEFSGAGLNVYPNPFSGLLRIEGAEGTLLRIFTVDGRQVHAQKVAGAGETVNVEHLSAGLYIIRLENGGRVKTVKVIKN